MDCDIFLTIVGALVILWGFLCIVFAKFKKDTNTKFDVLERQIQEIQDNVNDETYEIIAHKPHDFGL